MLNRSAAIDGFLAQKRLALVGASRDPRNFSRYVFRELKQRGYDVVPVNPAGGEIDGQPCLPRVQDIQPPVDGALLMTAPAATVQVVRDCAKAGVQRVWMHRGTGEGAVSPPAVEFCRTHDIEVVAGECPLMFLPGTGWFHRLHGFFRRLGRRR